MTLALGIASAGTADAQQVVTVIGDNASDNSVVGTVGGSVFTAFTAVPITVDGAAPLSVSPISNTWPAGGNILFFLGDSSYAPTGTLDFAGITGATGFIAFLSAGIAAPASFGSIAPGEYVLYVGPDRLDNVGTAYEIVFTLNGAILVPVRTDIDSITAATGTAARLIVVGADGVVRDAGQVSIATRNGQTTFTRIADGTGSGDVTVSTSGAPGMMGSLYTWVEITGFRSDEFGTTNTGTIGGNGLQIGADMEIGPDMIAGLSLGYSTVNAVDGATTTEGTFTHLQPYFAYRSGAWSGSASLIYGMGSYEQNGAANTADVTLAAVTFEGRYDYALDDAFTLTPTLGLMHGREEIEGTGGTLAGTSSDVTFSQVSLGSRITHDSAEGSLFAGLHADYLTNETESVLAQDMLANDGWTGRVELGGEMALSNGMDLSTSVELSGLGGDMQTVSGALRVALRF